jgi:hypothetical protein
MRDPTPVSVRSIQGAGDEPNWLLDFDFDVKVKAPFWRGTRRRPRI